MGILGRGATRAPLNSQDITDGIITSAKIAADAITSAKLPADSVETFNTFRFHVIIDPNDLPLANSIVNYIIVISILIFTLFLFFFKSPLSYKNKMRTMFWGFIIVLAIIGGLFVLETVSVIIQVISFKLTGKRVFMMAPLHHHFEKKGWAESTVVIRFWIISIILALIGLATLKLR